MIRAQSSTKIPLQTSKGKQKQKNQKNKKLAAD
jgi:hypothetical protein